MRAVKILSLVVGGVVALVAVVLLAVWLLVNPNDFKPKIAAAVKKSIGRELTLKGDIKLSVFPWVALELGPASLGNPPGFSDQPFVAFNRASVRVKVLPLLSKRLEVGRVELDGLDVKLLKNAEGKGNWQDLGESGETKSAADTSESGTPQFAVEGIKITNARLSYEKMTVDNFSFETGSIGGSGVVPMTLHVEANRGVAGESATMDVRLDASADLAAKHYHVAALNLNAVATLAGNPRPVRVSVTAPTLDADLNTQALSIPAFAVNAAGADITGSAQGTNIVDDLVLRGGIKLAPLVVREYLPRLNLPMPKTRDPKAFSLVALSGDYEYGKGAARVQHLEATLDETHLKGSASVVLASEALKFDLAVDGIDADRYLAPPDPAGTPVPTPKTAAGEPAKPVDANGTLTVGSLHLAPLDLKNVVVTVATNDRVMHIFPLKAQVYGGQYSGDVTLDNRTAVAGLSLDEHLTGVDVGRLVAAESKTLHVTGRGNVNIKATAHGSGADAILKTLNGRFDMNVADGAVEGMDLGYALGQAEALIRKQPLPNTQNTKRTKFDALKMSADITNGVAATHDLTIASSVLKITGQGSANLPAKTLDFALVADTLRTAGNTPLQIPVKVTGSMADPTIRPDIAALAKGQLKQKVQDVLQDKLKGLFH